MVLIDRMRQWVGDPDAKFPKSLSIETTSACDLMCAMCGRDTLTRAKGVMEFALYKKIIDEVAAVDKGTAIWLTFFGEPMMAKEVLSPFLVYAKSRGIRKVKINSNGNRMDPDTVDMLIRDGLDEITFGIDAATEETYNKVRCGGDLNRVVENVSLLLQRKAEQQSPTPDVRVLFVEQEENIHEREAFIEFWNRRGATVFVTPKHSWIDAVTKEPLDGMKRTPCYWGTRVMAILWDGRVPYCESDFDIRMETGDVNRQTIQAVWQETKRSQRQALRAGRLEELPEFCQSCTDWRSQAGEKIYQPGKAAVPAVPDP